MCIYVAASGTIVLSCDNMPPSSATSSIWYFRNCNSMEIRISQANLGTKYKLPVSNNLQVSGANTSDEGRYGCQFFDGDTFLRNGTLKIFLTVLSKLELQWFFCLCGYSVCVWIVKEKLRASSSRVSW